MLHENRWDFAHYYFSPAHYQLLFFFLLLILLFLKMYYLNRDHNAHQWLTPPYQPLQHIYPPWNPATRCMTQWGTAPPKGDQTPDTLAHKTKQTKKPTLELGFCFKQKKNKSQKAAKRITSLLCFFYNRLLKWNKWICPGTDPKSLLGLLLRFYWKWCSHWKFFFNASQSEPTF